MVEISSSNFPLQSGETLCVHRWNPNVATPKAICIIYHGFLAHARYPTVRYAADLLSANGMLVVAPDMRGHGESPGLSHYLASAEQVIDDAKQVAEKTVINEHSVDQKVFFLGSSMGGTIALSVAQRMPGKIAGVILLAPMLKLSVDVISRNLLLGLSYIHPTWEIIPSSSTDSSKQYRDEEKRKECDNDPHVPQGKKIRVGSASTCVQLAHNIQDEFKSVTVPFLLCIADEDTVVDNAGSETLLELSPSTDKTCKRYPALHGLLCEPSPLVDTIQNDILSWIHERC